MTIGVVANDDAIQSASSGNITADYQLLSTVESMFHPSVCTLSGFVRSCLFVSDYPFKLLLAYRGEQVGGGCLHVVHDFDRSSRIGSEFNRASNLLRDIRRFPLTKYGDITILP
jgi:hypothetical protein